MEKALLLDLKASLLMRAAPVSRRVASPAPRHGHLSGIRRDAPGRPGAGQMSSVHALAGEPEKAIALLYRALDLIDPTREPRLRLIAWHNLIDDLTETGQFMEAHKLLVKARPLYQKFPQPWFRNPRKWMEGKIARGLGQIEQAETLFLEARDGFLLMDAVYDMALVSLDLASLYAEQGRMAELKRLAEEMVPIFSSRQIHREALAALDYWRQAVEAEQACAATLIAGIASFLKRGHGTIRSLAVFQTAESRPYGALRLEVEDRPSTVRPGATVTSWVWVPSFSCQASSVYLPGGRFLIEKAPSSPLTA